MGLVGVAGACRRDLEPHIPNTTKELSGPWRTAR
jgi:hypothetical protein